MDSEQFNNTQKELLLKAEEAYLEGLRHRGLSGLACEQLLINALRKSIKKFNFNGGLIKYGEKDGFDLTTKDLSPQQDILIYRSKPLFESASGHVVLHANDVLATVEVKKKVEEGNKDRFLEKINKFKEGFFSKTDRKIICFLITYYYYGKDSSEKQVNNNTVLNNDNVNFFYFFGPWQKGKRIKDMEEWKTFENESYSKQYRMFVESINKIP